jgi:DNA-binding LytR/AlgR family response regulator
MNKIRCLIIDDEPPALDLLESYVVRTPFLELTGKCMNAFKVLEIIDQQSIDLLFLDIQMPDFNGIELSRTLGTNISVIFTTAFQQYAIEGYKVDAIDYLLKPFNYEEFLKAAKKARERFRLTKSFTREESQESILFVRSGYMQVKIDLKNVLYIESLKDYVKIHLVEPAPPVLSLMSLKTLENCLPKQNFLRIHRSYIINLERIDAIERSQVLIGKERITIADPYIGQIQKYVAKHTIRIESQEK